MGNTDQGRHPATARRIDVRNATETRIRARRHCGMRHLAQARNAEASVARMEPSGHAFGVPKDKLRAIRESRGGRSAPDCAALHPGYEFSPSLRSRIAKQSMAQQRGYGLLRRCAPRNDEGGHSRGAKAPEFCMQRAPQRSEGAGNAGCAMHPQPRVRMMKSTRASHHRFTGTFRLSLHNGLRLIPRSPR